MLTRRFCGGLGALALAILLAPGPSRPGAASGTPAPAPSTVYTLSFPEPQQRWMQVEAEFPAVEGPLPLRMSRTSPGRYALHEFAKNVYDVRALDAAGGPAPLVQIAPHAWEARGGGGPLRVRYRVFGDRLDGTYLAIDETHAHINIPPALMWAEGREMDPVVVRIEPPEGLDWRVATQLFPTADPFVFTAPNLPYLIDSPIEVSAHGRYSVTAEAPPGGGGAGPAIVLALHHTGTAGDAERFVAELGRMVREQAAIFGEYPAFDGGTYTFIADYLPWAAWDGMEHRNSTVLTHAGTLAANGPALLATAAHEFFHAWNVERIRPRSLEPFNLLDFNVSGELWLAEGFTSYYETLTLVRSGGVPLDSALGTFGERISRVLTSPAPALRSAVEMSRLALVVDGHVPADRTNLGNTHLSYYTHGAALAMGFDLAIRERSGGARSLDDVMRALWTAHGRPQTGVPGLVARPYDLDDVRRHLADVAGRDLAANLIDRYVLGRETMDYARLVALAGLRLRPAAPRRASLGDLSLEDAAGRVRVGTPPPPGSPAAAAGLAQDDEILMVAGRPIRHPGDVERVLASHEPGQEIAVQIRRRSDAATRRVTVRLAAPPDVALVTIESAGGTLDAAARAFREQWLSTRVR